MLLATYYPWREQNKGSGEETGSHLIGWQYAAVLRKQQGATAALRRRADNLLCAQEAEDPLLFAHFQTHIINSSGFDDGRPMIINCETASREELFWSITIDWEGWFIIKLTVIHTIDSVCLFTLHTSKATTNTFLEGHSSRRVLGCFTAVVHL